MNASQIRLVHGRRFHTDPSFDRLTVCYVIMYALHRCSNICGHRTLKAPHPVRSAKLSKVSPSQYCGGGPRGNPRCCSSIFFAFCSLLHVMQRFLFLGQLTRTKKKLWLRHVMRFFARGLLSQPGSSNPALWHRCCCWHISSRHHHQFLIFFLRLHIVGKERQDEGRHNPHQQHLQRRSCVHQPSRSFHHDRCRTQTCHLGTR